jgi:Domain of unknown function (DUF5671)
MNQELREFVRDSLGRGVSREKIREALLAARWPADEVERAMDQFAEIDFPVPVPHRRPYLSAQEAFLYLLAFVTLYVSAIDVGGLLFALIEKHFPDPLDRSTPASFYQVITLPLASVIVAFPIYLWITGLLTRRVRRDPELRASKIRKWLTYVTLFVAAGTIIGDLITLLTRLLEGELTPRFLLKVLTVLVIAGLVFTYYLVDLRPEEKETP